MVRTLDALMAAVLVAAFTAAAAGTTVRVDLVPSGDLNATSVTVQPGTDVPYQIYVQVTSDDAATSDNNGLSFFTIDVLTTLGVTQQPMDSFAALIAESFPIVQSLGTSKDDDIVQIGGGQNTFAGGSVTAGIGTEQQLIGQGRFLTPSTEGSYTVGIGPDSQANVLQTASLTSATQATLQAGAGFTIVVAQSSTSDATTQADTTSQTDTTTETTTTGSTTDTTLRTLAFAGGAVILALVAAMFLMGPLAAMFAIVLLPLLLIILLQNI